MRRARMMMACGCALAAAGATPPAAQAASLAIWDGPGDYYRDGTMFLVEYDGDPGERNRVTATYDRDAGKLTIRDTGALAIRPVPHSRFPTSLVQNCQYGVQTVTCTHEVTDDQWFQSLQFRLGDGDDRADVTIDAWGATISGGDGNDTLRAASEGYMALSGGAGADSLIGGAGDQSLAGGPGADRVDGGAGSGDSIHYDTSRDPLVDGTVGVTVTMDGVADDGDPGEGDNVLGTVDRVTGTSLDDVLVGDGGAQTLIGHLGDDRIDGGGGDDRLEGHAGHDRIDGGAGADVLLGQDGDDALTGGPGGDSVYGQGAGTTTGVTTSDVDTLDLRDGERDNYGCGNFADAVLADGFDVFGYGAALTGHPSECETVEVL